MGYQLIFLKMKIISRIQKLWDSIKKKSSINFRYKFLEQTFLCRKHGFKKK